MTSTPARNWTACWPPSAWRIRCRAAAAAAVLGGLAGCGGPRPEPAVRLAFDPSAVDGGRALEEVRRLVELGSRDAGSPGALRAAYHLRARLERLGLPVRIDEFEDDTPHGRLVFRNVIAHLEGTGPELIVLGSHFDTMSGMDPGFQGANDSGSSTGLLLELARVMSEAARAGPPPAGIQFAFFDGEEAMVRYGPRDGLHGSRYHARRLLREGWHGKVRAVIVLDMVGDRDLTVTIPRNGTPWLIAAVLDAAHAEGVRSRFGLYPGAILDDHVPFLEAGFPAVNIIDFEYGSRPGANDYWHTAEDTLDKLSAESLGTVGRVTLRMVNGLLAGRPGT